jgi:parvulin-like peptidyl-prolyl isomerase
LLAVEKVPLTEFRDKFAETGVGKHSAVNMSEELRHKDLEVSEAFKEILFKLEPGTYSKPIAQKSRRDHSTVWRIFYLKQIIQGGMVPFDEVEEQLKENLIDAAIDKETDAYFAKLRERFSVEEPDLNTAGLNGFQPFILK